MKIKKQAIEVEFTDVGEAARFLFGYTNRETVPGQKAAADEFGFETSSTYEERRAAARAAAKLLASYYHHAAPTYISGSSDRVYLISEMPTRYIRNVLAMPAMRQSKGVNKALYDELVRRGATL